MKYNLLEEGRVQDPPLRLFQNVFRRAEPRVHPLPRIINTNTGFGI